jgi:DNA polymerase-3 subunit alpha
MPYGDVDRIAKLIPATVGITIDKALEEQPELRKAYDNDPDSRADRYGEEAGRPGARLGRSCVGGGDCAAAADRAGADQQDQERRNRDRLRHEGGRKDGPAQDGLSWADHADGDYDCLKLIEQTRGEKLDIDTIPLDDERPIKKVFHTALTSGVFQFESSGMRDILRRYKPIRWRT